jgi:hypothetical protein
MAYFAAILAALEAASRVFGGGFKDLSQAQGRPRLNLVLAHAGTRAAARIARLRVIAVPTMTRWS